MSKVTMTVKFVAARNTSFSRSQIDGLAANTERVLRAAARMGDLTQGTYRVAPVSFDSVTVKPLTKLNGKPLAPGRSGTMLKIKLDTQSVPDRNGRAQIRSNLDRIIATGTADNSIVPAGAFVAVHYVNVLAPKAKSVASPARVGGVRSPRY